MVRWMILIAISCTATAAMAKTSRDKSQIIEKVTAEIMASFKSRVVNKVLAVQRPKGNTSNFSKEDVEQVRLRFITALQGNGYSIVDDDHTEEVRKVEAYQGSGAVEDSAVQEMGHKAGVDQIVALTFNETIGRYDQSESDVTISVTLNAVEVKTGRIVIAKVIDVKYSDTIYHEMYPIRDTSALVLGIVKWTALGSSLYFGTQGWLQTEKATLAKNKAEDAATPAADKAKYLADSEAHKTKATNHYLWSGGALGAMVVTWVFQSHLESLPRDTTDYHKFNLSLVPTFNGNGLGKTSNGYALNWSMAIP